MEDNWIIAGVLMEDNWDLLELYGVGESLNKVPASD